MQIYIIKTPCFNKIRDLLKIIYNKFKINCCFNKINLMSIMKIVTTIIKILISKQKKNSD